MRGYIKALLITAMSAASVATGSMVSVATPDPTPNPKILNYNRHWPAKPGWFTSHNKKAFAQGHVKVTFGGFGKNRVVITGKLYDRDFRPLPHGKCAYARFGVHHLNGGWGPLKHYVKCGPEKFTKIRFTRDNVDKIVVTVCQTPWDRLAPTQCGTTKTIFPFVSPRDL
ncbi:hypothetical protein [Nonomuraea sp. LPB2021202275-12-8]|uniref:hypothetical protein n=1 Tax=Nonomuraea sp. LPB2021202275-12-8 TaxID=3120159 RepID=UPI00300D44D6